MKTSNEQLDDRVVEVHWDPVGEHWRMMRFRDDKPHGNHKSVVDNIIKSDGPLTPDSLFTNSIFRNIVISILATLGLYILASLIFVGFSSSRDQNLSRSSCARSSNPGT